jgi:fatty-acyl-CoA synthase
MRLYDTLDFYARIQPDAEFAVFAGRRMTYSEAARTTNRIANALIGDGLAIGDRVAFLAKNSIESVLFYYGAAKAGVVPVPLNYRLALPEWAYIVGDARAKSVIASAAFHEAIDAVRADLPAVQRWRVFGAAPRAGWQAYEEWIAGASDAAPGRFIEEQADAYQMYTSGTTGRPKGAVITQHAVTSNVIQFLIAYPDMHRERFLIVAPVYHAAAAICSFLTIASAGSLVIQEDFAPGPVVDALCSEGITFALLVPAMIQACLVMVPDVERRDYSKLKRILYGASPIAEQTLRRALEIFACEFVQGYGMTETTAAVTNLRPEDHQRGLRGEKPQLLLSAGRALPGTDVMVVDEHDRPLPNGSIGEIVARGPQLMRGYWNLEAASREALRGGWMHTGDAGTMDDEGFLYIQDRVKDMIVSGGENIYPREIEEVLYTHPAIAEAAIIGVPDEKWGETVKAIVVLKQNAGATAEDIVAFCRGKLAGYKQPRSVDFIAALPRNPSGKVLKRELREPYWKGHTRRVS